MTLYRNLFFFRSMNYAPMKDQVDPHRFTGKMFTRRKTFLSSVDDYCIRIDGLTAGRIMKKILPGQRGGLVLDTERPTFPGPKSHDGQEDTFEAARDEFKKVFWQWQAWALQQPGKVPWDGADK